MYKETKYRNENIELNKSCLSTEALLDKNSKIILSKRTIAVAIRTDIKNFIVILLSVKENRFKILMIILNKSTSFIKGV